MIVGAIWPQTGPEAWEQARDVQHAKGLQLLEKAESLRQNAQTTAGSQSGAFVDGFCDAVNRAASLATSQADDVYFPMARVSEEAGRLVQGLREDLDKIDLDAHEQIQQLEQEFKGTGAALYALVMEIVAKARMAAMAKSTTATASMTGLTARLGSKSGQNGNHTSKNPPVAQPAGNPGEQADNDLQGLTFGGGGRGLGQMPRSPVLGGPKPDSPAPGDLEAHDAGLGSPGDSKGDGAGGATGPAGSLPAGNAGDGGKPAPGAKESGGLNAGPRGVPGRPPVIPAGLSGSGDSGDNGFKMPSGMGGMRGLGGMPTGLPGGGMPGGGMPGGGGGMPGGGGGMPGGGMPGGGMTPPMSAPPPLSTDFSKGFDAGLGGGAPAAAVPPVQSAPAPATAAPAGAAPVGPAPVSAAAGAPASAPAVSAPVAMPAGPAVGGPAVPAAMGPLPPFGSDVARSASIGAGAATVSPASGAGMASPVSAGGAGGGGGPMTPLPPGVLGSGVGASASAAVEGVRSALPDPLLESATRLLHQLLHDSSNWPYMDWCVGAFQTGSGVETVITSSDGLGYIPVGMFVPRTARLLFTDPGLTEEFRSRWFAWANPAETMIAYAKFINDVNPNVDLCALAVSTSDGGSAMPARSAGLVHFDEVSRFDVRPDMAASPLDDSHVHRLETLDRAQYVRTAGFGDLPKPGMSEAWRTTQTTVQVVLERLGTVRDFAVPSVIREIMDSLHQGVPVRDNRWVELEQALHEAAATGGGLRSGRIPGDGPASAHVRAYNDLARLAELLLLWKNSTMAHAELSYLSLLIGRTPLVA